MKTVDIKVLKAQALELIDEVEAKRITIEITQDGRPIAHLLPIAKYQVEDLDKRDYSRAPAKCRT